MARPAPDRSIDCSDLRLGDRMALAWLGQATRRRSGAPIAVIDRATGLQLAVSLPRYFPETFVEHDAGPSGMAELPSWQPGNLWLSAANAFAACGEPGCFEALPEPVPTLHAEICRQVSTQPRVLIHVLDDVTYNARRGWDRADVVALTARLEKAGCQVVLLNPARASFLGGFDRMLAEMLAADLFIGGDSGPSHVFAMLRGGASQLALYPDMARDRAAFRAEQRRLGLPLPWSSLPFQSGLDVVRLAKRKRLVREGQRWRLRSVGRFDPAEVAGLALGRLAQTKPRVRALAS